MRTALIRTSVFLTLTDANLGYTLEEWLWTLDGIESITHRMDGEEHYQGLQVISAVPEVAGAIKALCTEHGWLDQLTLHPAESVTEEDWAESWKQYWHVNRILPHLVIQPSWETFTPDPEDIVLRLDPGSAFGTGTHETTQLMLFLIDDALRRGLRPPNLLDVGTGSGILAIYAAKLGVPTCQGIDNDPHAVEVAQENAERNEVLPQLTCSPADITTMPQDAYAVVVANILAPILCEMMGALKRTLSPTGKLLLGGITTQQLPQMRESIEAHGLKLTRILQKGAWIALVCQK